MVEQIEVARTFLCPHTEPRFIRLREVLGRVPLSRSRVFELIAAGRFPKQIRLSDRASAWIEAEIDAWMEARIRMSRQPPAASTDPREAA
jgi:prophage regulatory protein